MRLKPIHYADDDGLFSNRVSGNRWQPQSFAHGYHQANASQTSFATQRTNLQPNFADPLVCIKMTVCGTGVPAEMAAD
jgi:hypothetical protein